MTSSKPNKTTSIRRRRGAFTMVEMLVVVGIVLVLMGIFLPGLNRAWKGSVRTRMAADMQAITVALEAYKADHGGYPPVHSAGTGAHQLARALIGPGGNDPTRTGLVDGYGKPRTDNDAVGLDGAPGFRTRAGGKVYPAYLPLGKFPVVDPLYIQNPQPDLYTAVIGDRYRQPILYFAGNKLANPTHADQGYVRPAAYVPMGTGGFIGARPMFNSNDSAGYFDPSLVNGPRGGRVRALNLDEGRKRFQLLMGDANQNGVVDNGEAARFTGPYIIWSAGPDEIFGPPTEGPVGPKNRCDDVANFERAEY